MIEWILEKLPILIFVLVFLSQIVRGIFRSRQSKVEPPPRNDSLEEHRRNEEIRRRIAERRGGRVAPAAEPAPRRAEAPPVMRRDPTAIPLPDPLGGPLRRFFEELEEKAPPEPPLVVQQRAAELERQEQIAEELRALEDARAAAQRRAANLLAAQTAATQTENALRVVARRRLLDDLRDPQSLRQAFVLREVLGPPVGLR